MSKEGFALIRLEDVVEVTRPQRQTELELTHIITGSDEEFVQVASELLDERMSSLGARKVEQGSGSSRQFFYSKKNWNVSWDPKGSTPPWAQNPGEN